MHQIYCRNVAALMPHEGFKPDGSRGSDNDILVLKTDNAFQINQHVKVIQLAEIGHDPKGERLTRLFWKQAFQ